MLNNVQRVSKIARFRARFGWKSEGLFCKFNSSVLLSKCRILLFQGVTEVKPIVYGNISKGFGKKREEDGHTHQWTVYVKPYNNEDMSTYVKKIHFKLHESYENPNRIITKPPYEVSETGWGEFEVVIKIYFHDPTIYKWVE